MPGYSVFAQYYDRLTANAAYSRRAEYFLELLERLGHAPGLTLDLACGTGSFTLELFQRGVDVYGVDASVEMLSEARAKCAAAGAEILFLRQNMADLDLYGTVSTIVCTLDSINHLQGAAQVRRAFEKAAFFLDPGGYFIFDINTLYKHQFILGNNAFVYDLEELFCVWQNRFTPAAGKVDIRLDFFQRDGRLYHRSGEHFSEYAYPLDKIQLWLKEAGFVHIDVFDELSFDPPAETSQRVVVAAKKGEWQGRWTGLSE